MLTVPNPLARDVAYYADPPDDHAAQQCRLDVYAPAAANFPVILYLHGGGLEMGDRNHDLLFVHRMVQENVGVVTADYRLAPHVSCPAYLQDAAAALAWTMDHMAAMGGDVSRIYISGHSAGAYLATMVALDPQYLRPFNHGVKEIAGLIAISGQMVTHHQVRAERGIPITQPVVDEFSPIHHAPANGPPMLLLVGDADMPARLEENLYFAAARKLAGHEDVTTTIIPGRNHATIMDLFDQPDDETTAQILHFLRR